MRVNVTPDSSAAVEIEVRGPFEIRDVCIPSASSIPERRWNPRRCAPPPKVSNDGNRHWTAKEIELQPRGSALIRLGSHEYSGAVRFIHALDDRWQAINHLPLEEYLASVVDSEMPLEFGLEARKAQAVVARTYVVHRCLAEARRDSEPVPRAGGTHAARSTKVSATARGMAAGWLAHPLPVVRPCVRHRELSAAMKGRSFLCITPQPGRRTYHGREFFPDAAEPVRSVSCPGCVDAPLFRWDRRVDRRTGITNLSLASSRKSDRKSISQIRRKPRPVGSLPRYILGDGRRQITLSGWELRRLLGSDLLPSPEFEVTWNHQSCLVHGQGMDMEWDCASGGLADCTQRDVLSRHPRPLLS